jgi:hypothetical protein
VCLCAVGIRCQSRLAVPPCCRCVACLCEGDTTTLGWILHSLSLGTWNPSKPAAWPMMMQRQHLQRHGCRRHTRRRRGLLRGQRRFCLR